ncbi:hypothetical protein R0I01_08225 [Bacillus pumilus]|nr:hypothetical protein R0I01_08225 [Bacillus pumilus]
MARENVILLGEINITDMELGNFNSGRNYRQIEKRGGQVLFNLLSIAADHPDGCDLSQANVWQAKKPLVYWL